MTHPQTQSRIWTGILVGALFLAGTVPVLLGASPGHSEPLQRTPSQKHAANSTYASAYETSHSNSTFTLISPPLSLYQFVAEADAIVIGTVIEVAFERDEGPYSVSAPQNESSAAAVGPELATPIPERPEMRFTYYRLSVEDVLLNDGRINAGNKILLRVDGSASRSTGTYENLAPLPQVGQRALFVLNINPDYQSYGTRGPWGRITVDDSPISYDDWDKTPLPFANGLSSEEFLTQLEAMIREVQLEQQRTR